MCDCGIGNRGLIKWINSGSNSNDWLHPRDGPELLFELIEERGGIGHHVFIDYSPSLMLRSFATFE